MFVDAVVDWLGRIMLFAAALPPLLAITEPNPPQHEEPPLPPGPAAKDPERRGFLAKLSIVLGSLAAAAIAIPGGWYLLGPLLRHVPNVWRPVGKADSFPEGETVKVAFRNAAGLPWSGDAGITAAWLRREKGGQFTAFAVYCSHLGCPVRWEASAQLFMCPCHGGVYYADGTVTAGPPPRPLARYPVRVRNGQVEIQTAPLPIAGKEV